MGICGAVSRHQHHATVDDLLALLNAVIAGAVFSESMLASAYMYAARCVAEEARHKCGSCSRLCLHYLSTNVDRQEYDSVVGTVDVSLSVTYIPGKTAAHGQVVGWRIKLSDQALRSALLSQASPSRSVFKRSLRTTDLAFSSPR